ncbi:hypothetical protein [Fibrobacter sp. UWH4]|uniref:hypothetical protein n=1 Tax=Fibrobacter sp. UWH4 TaxID=1896210 RepID=UPI00091D241C|nr:hypothetical protein [Fibrobacter sp. UWH4]SHK20350.1 hypothetical protein SAMN05720762_10160 [Fibrobacter sp. UWH4]
MFGLVFSNKHIAKPFIEHLLNIKIDHLETPIPEAVLSYDAEHKGVRYDVFALSKGGYYTSLKEQYVIFLCPMDIFGRGHPCYHFENRASEDPSITLGDLSYKNFYIFKRYEKFTDPVVKAYMKYFATRNADSRETKTINDQVSLYKADTLIRNKYMTYEFDLHESEEKGKTKAQVETAVTMLADGEPVEKIVKYSRLSEEEVLKLRESSMESATK